MKTLHLFAGAGGGLLADLILGHEPIGAVEIDHYCCEVLRRRADEGWFLGLRVHETDIRLFDPSEYAGRVDCVSGGFPCQDISAAGRGAGIASERSGLWSEFARVIRAVRPRYAFIENSPMLTLRGLDVVLSDLAALGFDAEWAVVSAADAGAPHLRERIWILANDPLYRWREGRERGSYSSGQGQTEQSLPFVANASSGRLHGSCGGEIQQPGRTETVGTGEVVADADKKRWNGRAGQQREGWGIEPADSRKPMANPNRPRQSQPQGGQREQRGWAGDGRETGDANGPGLEKRQGQPGDDGAQQPAFVRTDWWQLEPDVGRVAHGVAHRAHRLKALGNGQVPIQAAIAWKILYRRG